MRSLDALRALADDNRRLRAENATLRAACGLPHMEVSPFGLTVTEHKIFMVLMARPIVSREALHNVLYGNRADGGPSSKVIEVFIVKIRKKIAPCGFRITTSYDVGWFIPEPDKSRIREHLNKESPNASTLATSDAPARDARAPTDGGRADRRPLRPASAGDDIRHRAGTP